MRPWWTRVLLGLNSVTEVGLTSIACGPALELIQRRSRCHALNVLFVVQRGEGVYSSRLGNGRPSGDGDQQEQPCCFDEMVQESSGATRKRKLCVMRTAKTHKRTPGIAPATTRDRPYRATRRATSGGVAPNAIRMAISRRRN